MSEEIIDTIVLEYEKAMKPIAALEATQAAKTREGISPELKNQLAQRREFQMSQTQEMVLRDTLRRVLGTEEQLKKMLTPAAEKAIQEIIKEVEKRLKGRGDFNIDLTF